MAIVKRIAEVEEIDLSDGKDVVGVRKKVLIGPSDGAPTFAVRLFRVAPEGHTPHHSHPHEHGVVVLKGEGELVAGGKKLRIEAGMVAFVPPGEPHQFLNKGAGPLEFLCIVPVHVEG